MILDTIWILGIVGGENPCNFYVKRIVNRQINTIQNALKPITRAGPVLHSDGCPSSLGEISHMAKFRLTFLERSEISPMANLRSAHTKCNIFDRIL